MENVDPFFICFIKGGSASVPSPSVHAVKMTDSLAENFKMRFNDIHSYTTNTQGVAVTSLE
jgi:hypothetical protein